MHFVYWPLFCNFFISLHRTSSVQFFVLVGFIFHSITHINSTKILFRSNLLSLKIEFIEITISFHLNLLYVWTLFDMAKRLHSIKKFSFHGFHNLELSVERFLVMPQTKIIFIRTDLSFMNLFSVSADSSLTKYRIWIEKKNVSIRFIRQLSFKSVQITSVGTVL